jgi:hypothetical protein
MAMTQKRKPEYRAFFLLGIPFIVLAFTTNLAFLGVGVVFFILGVGGMRRQRNSGE